MSLAISPPKLALVECAHWPAGLATCSSGQARADGRNGQALLALLGDGTAALAAAATLKSSQAPFARSVEQPRGAFQAGILGAGAGKDGRAGILGSEQARGPCASQLLQLASGAEAHNVICSHAGNQHGGKAQGDHSELGHR
jgi:hypothetical protein